MHKHSSNNDASPSPSQQPPARRTTNHRATTAAPKAIKEIKNYEQKKDNSIHFFAFPFVFVLNPSQVYYEAPNSDDDEYEPFAVTDDEDDDLYVCDEKTAGHYSSDEYQAPTAAKKRKTLK